jgi:hypothetical protein
VVEVGGAVDADTRWIDVGEKLRALKPELMAERTVGFWESVEDRAHLAAELASDAPVPRDELATISDSNIELLEVPFRGELADPPAASALREGGATHRSRC